ncbi:MAG: hypothetical protein M3Q72_00485 [Actinomycetota bacterium]|nr:hypothetical protein [Actinomycetota bacterium]
MGGFIRVLLTGLAIVSATIVGAPFAEDDRAHACSCSSTTLRESATCGIGVPLAQEWVIFSRRRGDDTFWSRDVAPDELVSTFCDGNRRFGPTVERRLGEPSIEPVAAPPSTSSPDSEPQPSPAASSAAPGGEDDDSTVVPIGIVAATAAAVTAVVVLRRAQSRHRPV